MCSCFENMGHFARDGSMREKTQNLLEMKGHLYNMCRKTRGEGVEDATEETEELVKPPAPASRLRVLFFAKGTENEAAQSGAEGMMFEELMSTWLTCKTSHLSRRLWSTCLA